MFLAAFLAGSVAPFSSEVVMVGLAALGISQESNALAIIVSEETGRISVAQKGEFRLRLSAEELESIISNAVE